ncbi:TPA: hypothetical protein N6Z41_004877 [Escherichia coli]|nr:hypothetical protein [Escherichia coli]
MASNLFGYNIGPNPDKDVIIGLPKKKSWIGRINCCHNNPLNILLLLITTPGIVRLIFLGANIIMSYPLLLIFFTSSSAYR